jgi:hypothetical protein
MRGRPRGDLVVSDAGRAGGHRTGCVRVAHTLCVMAPSRLTHSQGKAQRTRSRRANENADTIGSLGWSRRSCSHLCTVSADAAVPGRRCAALNGIDAATKLAVGPTRRGAVGPPPETLPCPMQPSSSMGAEFSSRMESPSESCAAGCAAMYPPHACSAQAPRAHGGCGGQTPGAWRDCASSACMACIPFDPWQPHGAPAMVVPSGSGGATRATAGGCRRRRGRARLPAPCPSRPRHLRSATS